MLQRLRRTVPERVVAGLVQVGNHPDLVVDGGDVDTEVRRLLALGATHADVGQRGDEGFVVLHDPEGNEFCLLHRARPRPGRGPATTGHEARRRKR